MSLTPEEAIALGYAVGTLSKSGDDADRRMAAALLNMYLRLTGQTEEPADDDRP